MALTLPLVHLRTMLSRSDTWQTWTATATEAAALGHVYYYAVPGSTTAETADAYEARLATLRPYAVLATGEYSRERYAGGPHSYEETGEALVIIEDNVPTAYAGDDDESDLGVWFESNLGGVIEDLTDLSGGATDVLSIRSVSVQDGPAKLEVDGDRMILQVVLAVNWGI